MTNIGEEIVKAVGTRGESQIAEDWRCQDKATPEEHAEIEVNKKLTFQIVVVSNSV
jgi:hypothetical protein